MRIAVVGAGVSGLVAARLLNGRHDVTVFEANDYVGGHTHTVHVELDDAELDVDTGFIVYNEQNYPLFTALLRELEVATQPSPMSFSVSREPAGIEYRATSFGTLFAQRANLLRPSFHRMLVDIARFNRAARAVLEQGDEHSSLDDLLARGRFSRELRDHFVVPLGSSIWSADPAHFGEMPAMTYARFMANHGLLSFGAQPLWRTVTGGAHHYVRRLLRDLDGRVRSGAPVERIERRDDGVELVAQGHDAELFDAVVVATHADEALALLVDATPDERSVLGAIGFQPNTATLHTDSTMMPRNRRAWASWNYHLVDDAAGQATLTYYMNALQSLTTRHDVLVTLNREDAIDPSCVVASFSYHHPVLDAGAVAAQRRRSEIQGRRNTYFCGAYWEYGFHEDGVRSAYDVAALLGHRHSSSVLGAPR